MRHKRCTHCSELLAPRQNLFCSLGCHRQHEFEERLRVLAAGQYPPVTNNAGFIRRALIHLLGEKCTRCGWKERNVKTGHVPVEVEHLDGDWQNNSLNNLTLLCPNCHALTPTFRALNKGRGRAYRKGSRENPLDPNKARIGDGKVRPFK